MVRQLQSREALAPEAGGGMDSDNCCLQAAVWGRYSSAHGLSWMGEKLSVSFVTAALGALGAAQLPSPMVRPLPRARQIQAASPSPSAWPSDKMRVNSVFSPCREKAKI